MSGADPAARLSRARLRGLQQLKTAAGRRAAGAFLIDGEKLVRDALAADAPVVDVLSTRPERWAAVRPGLTPIRLSRADAERLSDTRTPQGDFALVRDELGSAADAIRALPTDAVWHGAALDGVQDPGNAGAIIRAAAAFGLELVLAGAGSADPTHPRVTRAATGAWFHAKLARSADLAQDLSALRERGARVIAADAQGRPLPTIEIDRATVWLFGSEGSGIRSELAALVDERAVVPIAAEVESLNVAVAAGIIFHQIRRTAGLGEGRRPCASRPGT